MALGSSEKPKLHVMSVNATNTWNDGECCDRCMSEVVHFDVTIFIQRAF